MMRAINVSERGIWKMSLAPLVIPANAATEALPNQVREPHTEMAYRYIQNVGANNMFYSIGETCTSEQYDGILTQYQQLDCSAHRLSVSVFSAAGTTVARTVLMRNDQGPNNSLQPVP